MPTYVYETIPSTDDELPQRFEVRQSMNDAALAVHPESGVPVRRLVSGGFGYLKKGGGGVPAQAPSGHG